VRKLFIATVTLFTALVVTTVALDSIVEPSDPFQDRGKSVRFGLCGSGSMLSLLSSSRLCCGRNLRDRHWMPMESES
jgi:hypothetical protein